MLITQLILLQCIKIWVTSALHFISNERYTASFETNFSINWTLLVLVPISYQLCFLSFVALVLFMIFHWSRKLHSFTSLSSIQLLWGVRSKCVCNTFEPYSTPVHLSFAISMCELINNFSNRSYLLNGSAFRWFYIMYVLSVRNIR